MINIMRNDFSDLLHTDFSSLYLHNLKNQLIPSLFVEKINHQIYQGFHEIALTFDDDLDFTFPNVIVPIAGYMKFFESEKIIDEFSLYGNLSNYIRSTYFNDPPNVKSHAAFLKQYPFDKIWSFNDEDDVYNIVNTVISELNKRSRIAEGVSNCVEYCLNEVLDNVLQHSGIERGLFMAQYLKGPNIINFSVFDSGYGIYNTLLDSNHFPIGAVDAITMSVKENVTRDKKEHQGNGLFMLHNLVKNNSSRLSITTHDGFYSFEQDQTRKGINTLMIGRDGDKITKNGCTTISFSINLNNPVDVVSSLGHEKN